MKNGKITIAENEWSWWTYPDKELLQKSVYLPRELFNKIEGNAFDVSVTLLLPALNQDENHRVRHTWRCYSRRGKVGGSIKVPKDLQGKIKGAVFAIRVRRVL